MFALNIESVRVAVLLTAGPSLEMLERGRVGRLLLVEI